jgi:hypothetical protein
VPTSLPYVCICIICVMAIHTYAYNVVRRVVGWVGLLSDVISGVESALWEGCYPASALAHGVCALVYV